MNGGNVVQWSIVQVVRGALGVSIYSICHIRASVLHTVQSTLSHGILGSLLMPPKFADRGPASA